MTRLDHRLSGQRARSNHLKHDDDNELTANHEKVPPVPNVERAALRDQTSGEEIYRNAGRY